MSQSQEASLVWITQDEGEKSLQLRSFDLVLEEYIRHSNEFMMRSLTNARPTVIVHPEVFPVIF